MDEKKWTDDERDEAFDRGMETMQRVALELYRRGREPLLAELEDCRARNADLCTMLEQVTRDRDHAEEALVRLETQRDEARADAERYLADLRRCASEPYERTRELEALQAEVGRLREMAHDFEAMRQDRDEARAEVERLRVLDGEHDWTVRDQMHACAKCGVVRRADGSNKPCRGVVRIGVRVEDEIAAAYRRGAEAMREACLGVVERFMDFGSPHPGMIAHKISALPIPEET